MKGLIVKAVSGDFTVMSDDDNYVCRPRGNMSYNEETIKVGDYVEFEPTQKVITKVYERKNSLIRPLISNIDKAFIITSVKEPELNLYLLDKMITIFEYNSIQSIIVFTKIDLLNEEELLKLDEVQKYYESLGYLCLRATKTTYDKKIYDEISDSICVLAGQSGAGKSTLINKISPELNQKTDNISLALGRGKHTTRYTQLFKVINGYLADTPGFGNMDFEAMEKVDLSNLFRDFWKERDDCKFSNCTHINEPSCAVKEKVANNIIRKSRYDNYLKFIEELSEIENWKKYH